LKRYKVVGTSKPEFMDIDLNVVFDDISIGKKCEVFGYTFTITQTGTVLVLANPDWVLTLQELPEEIVQDSWGHIVIDHTELRINHEVDLFFADIKEVKISSTDRIENGVTFKCLFDFLVNEWKYISHLTDIPFPFEYDRKFNLLVLQDEWNIVGDFILLREGSFTRYNADGRCI